MKNTVKLAAALLAGLVLASYSQAGSTGSSDSRGGGKPGVLDKIEHSVARGAKAAASGIERGAQAAGRGIKRGAKATASAGERVAGKLRRPGASSPAPRQ
ncbi:MAG TPA: hypothetical protein VNS31_03570 [Ramlibacter sp.]|jgi:hypothetical protein|nr:hypothetical protein [Ramlibacter sp.]